MTEAMLTEALRADLEELGYVDVCERGGRVCALASLLYTVGLFVDLDAMSYSGRYCYGSMRDARAALQAWDGSGDPPGPWVKYKGEGGERDGPGIGG